MSNTQLQFQIQLPTSRPLVPVEAVSVLLDRDYDQVVSLIETGELSHAWDIRGKAAEVREIRILRDSVLSFLGDRGCRIEDGRSELGDWNIWTLVFPHSRPDLRGTEIQRIFSASPPHVLRLIADGLLDAITKPGIGANGSPRVSRESVIRFLNSRRIL